MRRLYQLIGGLGIYGAPEAVNGELVFDASRTCFVVPVPKGGASVQRCDHSSGKPTMIHVPLTAVVLWHDLTDPDALAAMESEISGLTLPSGLKIAH